MINQIVDVFKPRHNLEKREETREIFGNVARDYLQ